MELGHGWTLDCMLVQCWAAFSYHANEPDEACDARLKVVLDSNGCTGVVIKVARDIEAGEEILFDDGDEYWDWVGANHNTIQSGKTLREVAQIYWHEELYHSVVEKYLFSPLQLLQFSHIHQKFLGLGLVEVIECGCNSMVFIPLAHRNQCNWSDDNAVCNDVNCIQGVRCGGSFCQWQCYGSTV